MMKRFIQTAGFLFLIISLSNTVQSQGFNSIYTNDGVNIVAVGNGAKYYISSNGGLTWSAYYYGYSNMNAVTGYGSNVWIATDQGQICKTLNTYYAVNQYYVGSPVNLKSIYFVNASTGFVCGAGGSIYKSVDGGSTWTLSNTGVSPLVSLNSICFNDANNGITAGSGGNIYMTNDGGATWTLQSSLTTKNLLKAKYFNDSIVVAGEYGALLLYNGSWTSVDTRIKTDIRGIAGTGMNDIHLCGGGGFIRNNQNGNARFANFELNPMMANLSDIVYYGTLKGWAVSSLNNVIIYTTDGGTSWKMPAGSSVSYVWNSKLSAGGGIGNNLCEHPFDRNSMFVVYGATVYVSRDRGESWTSIGTTPGGSNAHSFYVSPLDTNVWMVATESTPDKVMRSTNYGANWTTILSMNFSNYGQPLEMDQNNPSTFYFAPDGGGFYKSTNNGASFTEISGAYPFRSPCDIVIMYDSSNVIFLADGVTGSGLADIFKSTNSGVNWTKVHTNGSSSEVPSMCNSLFDRSIAYATNWSGGQLYKTTNYGTNWFLLSTQTSSGWGSDICHEDPTLVLKGTYGSPTWLSTNSGANFTSTSIGGGAGAGIIVPDRGYLIAMQTSGLLKMGITYTDSVVNLTPKYLAEDFANVFPPENWTIIFSEKSYWMSSPVSSYGSGSGSAKFDFYNSPNGTNQSIVTPRFISSVSGDSLAFDVAYAPYTSGTDSLIIETSTNNGTSFTALIRLYGRAGATGANVLNTAPTNASEYTPTSAEWATRKYSLPVGTNKIRFRARSSSGNNLYLDKIKSGNHTLINIKAALQGMYNGWTMNLRDTIKVYLRNTVSPFVKVDSAISVIDSLTFSAPCAFNNVATGTYYIQIMHRNGLETWSKAGGELVIGGLSSSYDFTSMQSQSYGSNSAMVGSKWCIYSGDPNHDGAIDISDIIDIFNASASFETGYVDTDINGDNSVDISDIIIAFNNSSAFVSKITPETSPQMLKDRREKMKEDLAKFKSLSGPAIKNR